MTLRKVDVAPGIAWVEVPELKVRVLCGCPPDSIKHLFSLKLIEREVSGGITLENGPNMLLLSDFAVQNGVLANMAEFPILQMLYRQGMMIPGHPNNTGAKPLVVGTREQLEAQLAYIYRGNYGLVSEEELCATGMSAEVARERMQMKLSFAFGRIREATDFLDTRELGQERIELVDGLGLCRLAPNLFEFDHQGQRVRVDLNLKLHEHYTSPIDLPYRHVRREAFAVVHCGEGDGWDTERNSMASILLHEGRCYLVDAGPAVMHNLQALGIGLHEIDGVFHTHAHDDHFAGLPALMQSDRRLRYFATPEVRASVQKKLAALTSLTENVLTDYFDVVDLECEQWNQIDGLQVRPVFSPHPIETTVFFFRAGRDGEIRSFAHLADIASFKVLEAMVCRGPGSPGVSERFVQQAKQAYLDPVDLKKIDIGGGMIHGQAEDFRSDTSARILLSHTSSSLTQAQQEIGGRAEFGQIDVFFEASDRDRMQTVRRVLQRVYPQAQDHELEPLLSHEQVLLAPGTVFVHEGQHPDHVMVLLTGLARQHSLASAAEGAFLYAGSPAGERAVLLGHAQAWSLSAISHVQALKVPAEHYRRFVLGLRSSAELQHELAVLQTLAQSELFREGVSYPVLSQLARQLQPVAMRAHERLHPAHAERVMLLVEGSMVLQGATGRVSLGPGDYFGEEIVLGGDRSTFAFECLTDVQLYALPTELLREMPVCRWRMLETHRKRSRLTG